MLAGSIWNESADAWTAIGTWAAVGIAGIVGALAGTVGLRQLNEARQQRREEHQPYVVVLLEESGVGSHFYDLVIRNTGRTAAWDIRIDYPSQLESAALGPDASPITAPRHIDVLVPGQEWRNFWDFTQRRDAVGNLPSMYTVTVRFRDSQKRDLGPYEFTLDWNLLINRGTVDVRSPHDGVKAIGDGAKAVKDIADELRKANRRDQ